MNYIDTKRLWRLSYHNYFWIVVITENRLYWDIPYLIWHGTRPHYKYMNILGGWVYIINGIVTGKKQDNIYNRYYFMGYIQLPKVFYYTGKQTNHIISTEHIMHDLMNITLVYLPRKSTHNGSCKFNGIQKVFFSSTIYINVIPR